MICPTCHAKVRDGSKYCTECGTVLPIAAVDDAETRKKTLALAGSGAAAMGRAAREARLNAAYDPEALISTRAYNLILAGVVLWGLLINALLCAYVGDTFRYVNPLLFLVIYFICAFAGIRIAQKSTNPFVSFLGYNLVVIPVGLLVSVCVYQYGGIDSKLVTDAFVYTLLITAGMTAAAVAFPELFSKLGGALLGVLIGLIIAEVVLMLLGVQQVVTDWIAAGLFSLYIGYDIYRSQQFAKTVDNAVDCALDVYLDIINLFLRLLSILGKKKD